MHVLLSIKPEYVDRIFAGEKRFEYRRRLFADRRVTTVVIYATAPVMRIVGEFEIKGIIEDTPLGLWEQTQDHSGITFAFFDQYFAGREKAFAIKVGRVRRYTQPVEPREALQQFCAPQSFRYLR